LKFLAEPSGEAERKNSWQSQAAEPSGRIEELKFLAEPSGEAERKNSLQDLREAPEHQRSARKRPKVERKD